MPISKIRKRDGSIVDFDKEKIVNAIFKAAESVGGSDREESEKVAEKAIEYLNAKFREEYVPSVEDIQDIVEKALIDKGHAATAKSFILYRHRKTVERESKRILGVKDDLKLPLNSIQVLERRYLLRDDNGKISETPSQLFRRVADFIATNEKTYGADEKAERYFADAIHEVMANFEFLPNSPTLMNAGTGIGQLAACFVLPVPDDIEGIFDSVKNAAIIHKTGGGTGFCFSYIRPSGDYVRSTAGVASGPISFMSAFDNATNVIKQGGKRRGANMGVLHVWHPDIEEFITAKQAAGVLENFNVSVAVDDKFMSAVEKNEEYDLLNPRDGKPMRRVNARSIFKLIAYSAWKSAEPGLLFIDTMNNTNPTPKFPIKATNPCVSSDTLVTTNEGLVDIPKVHNPHSVIGTDGNYHPITWAGVTGEKELFEVTTNAGYSVKATADHKILTSSGWKKVCELKNSDELVLQKDGIFGKEKLDKEMALMLGWLVGDGTMTKDVQDVIFYFGNGEKEELLPIFKSYLDNINGSCVQPIHDATQTRLKYSSKIAKQFYDLGVRPVKSDEKQVPNSVFRMNGETIKYFLSSLFAADGSVQGSREKGISIRLASNSIKLLKQVQILLIQFGIACKIYEERRSEHTTVLPDSNRQPKEYLCKAQHELIISKESMFKFMDKIGFAISSKNEKFNSIKPNQIYSDDPDLHIKSVESIGIEKVYDLTEPNTHSFSANGLIVHNCGEVPMPDYESCNLGSINLVKYVEFDWSKTSWKKKINWDRLRYTVRLAVQFLDNVIDLNNYPIERIRDQTLYNRRMGLGVMGFAKMLTKMGVRYESEEGFRIGEEIMAFITDEARKMSHELGRARGSFPGFQESIWADKFDAMRNATVTSIAPTGTISMIADSSSGIEPIFALSYIKTVMDGTQLYYSDSVFEHVLKVRGLYSPDLMQEVIDNGSIQEMEGIPKEIREVFIVSHDVSVEGHVKMQAAFQRHTDLAVSKTINMPAEATVDDVEKAYMISWKEGCKGITIYREGSRGEGVLSMGKKKKESSGGEKEKIEG